MWAPLTPPLVSHVVSQLGGAAGGSTHSLLTLLDGVTIPDPTAFHFAAQPRVVGTTSVYFITQSAFRLRVAADPDRASVHLCFMLTNHVTVGLGGRKPETFGPGSALVITNWDSLEVDGPQPTRGLHLRLPRARLAERGVHFRSPAFRATTSTSLGKPLRAFASALVDASWNPTGIGTLTAERTIEDLVVGMFLETQGYGLDGDELRLGLRCRAISHIAAAHRDPELTPKSVAAQVSVSLRHLQRAFEGSGASITSEISKQRAHTAALLLAASGSNSLTTAEIARRSGFASTFELRAAVKAHYGVLPSEYRSIAHLDPSPMADSAPSQLQYGASVGSAGNFQP